MTLMRLLPRDEDGHPRPLRGHGEAVRWSSVTVARPVFPKSTVIYVGAGVAGGSLVRYLADGEILDPASLATTVAALAGVAVLAWPCGTVLLYLYAILPGGVEGRASRGR